MAGFFTCPKLLSSAGPHIITRAVSPARNFLLHVFPHPLHPRDHWTTRWPPWLAHRSPANPSHTAATGKWRYQALDAKSILLTSPTLPKSSWSLSTALRRVDDNQPDPPSCIFLVSTPALLGLNNSCLCFKWSKDRKALLSEPFLPGFN